VPKAPARVTAAASASRAGTLALLGTLGSALGSVPLGAQEWTSAQFSRQVSTEQSLDVTVHYSAGRIALSAGSGNQLYAMRLRYDADSHEPIHTFENGRLEIGVEGSGRSSLFRSGATDGEMELTLSNRVPIDLSLELGAVRADIDLGGLRLTDLLVNTGASDGQIRVSSPNPEEMERVELNAGAASFRASGLGYLNAARISLDAGVGDFHVDLAGLRRPETRLEVDMGLGNLEIRVPREAGIRLTRDSFLTSLDAPGLEERGDARVSSNWDDAAIRVEISVEAAFGSISVLRFDP
jgi:hypothetical protein